jgi:hypothetical protein
MKAVIMTASQFVKSAPALLGLALAIAPPANAQSTEADRQFLNEIFQTATSADENTARGVHGKCVAYLDRVAKMTNVSPVQRLHFEAEIDFCIYYAMHRGNFSDAAGDQCSYHYSYATKLARVIREGRGEPGFTADLMMVLGERLQRETSMGPAAGCTSDYSVFEPAIAVAKEEAAKPPPESPYKLWDDISAAAMSVTAENAREIHKTCLALSAKIGEKPGLSAAERLFYEGLIEDCLARASVVGNFSDENGDACAHHFRFAQKYAEGAAAAKDDPRYEERIAPVMRGELEIAKRQGPGMGCKQDYTSLKAE